MDLRKMYEMVIRHQLEILIDEKGYPIPENKIYYLTLALADNPDILEELTEIIQDHLECFGENYGL